MNSDNKVSQLRSPVQCDTDTFFSGTSQCRFHTVAKQLLKENGKAPTQPTQCSSRIQHGKEVQRHCKFTVARHNGTAKSRNSRCRAIAKLQRHKIPYSAQPLYMLLNFNSSVPWF